MIEYLFRFAIANSPEIDVLFIYCTIVQKHITKELLLIDVLFIYCTIVQKHITKELLLIDVLFIYCTIVQKHITKELHMISLKCFSPSLKL